MGSITPTSKSNPKSVRLLLKFAVQPAVNHLDGSQDFSADNVLARGTSMSHFDSILFNELSNLWGEFDVAWPYRVCSGAIAQRQTQLWDKYCPHHIR